MRNNENIDGGNNLNSPNIFEKASVLETMLELMNLIEIVGVDNMKENKENPLKPIENKLIILKGLLEKGSTIEDFNLLINYINLEVSKARYEGVDVEYLISKYKELPISRFEYIDNETEEGSEVIDFFLNNYREMVEKILPIMEKAKNSEGNT